MRRSTGSKVTDLTWLDDPFDLQRFLDAQDGVHDIALAELRAGRKRSHWMWFVFPQHAALGRSPTAKRFGLRSLEEAKAYLDHPVLRERLLAATRTANMSGATNLYSLLGAPDDLKFVSSMTLFEAAAPDEPLFARTLKAWNAGRDPMTLEALGQR